MSEAGRLQIAQMRLKQLFDGGPRVTEESRKPTFIIDLPSAEIDNKCGMAFWNHRIEGGRGLMLKAEVLPHMMIQETHNDLSMLAEMEDISPKAIQDAIDEILSHLSTQDRMDQNKMELLYRRLGWFAAYALFMEQSVRDTYEDIPIEPEIVLDRDPLWVVTYPDRLLRGKLNDKTVLYREFELMPAGLQSKKWLQSWEYKIRLHAGIAAAEQSLNVPISFGQIVGLYEGIRSSADGKLIHPYVWGYYNSQTEEWSYNSHIGSDAKDWVHTPVWEYGGGIVAWVRMCGKGIAENQFRPSPYIGLNRNLLEDWMDSRLARERQVSMLRTPSIGNHGMKNLHFEKRTANCMPSGGTECPFIKMCFDKKIGEMPLKSGFYVPNRFTIGGMHTGRED